MEKEGKHPKEERKGKEKEDNGRNVHIQDGKPRSRPKGGDARKMRRKKRSSKGEKEQKKTCPFATQCKQKDETR